MANHNEGTARGVQEKGVHVKSWKLWSCTRVQNKRQNGTLVHISKTAALPNVFGKFRTVFDVSTKMMFAFTPTYSYLSHFKSDSFTHILTFSIGNENEGKCVNQRGMQAEEDWDIP